MSHWTPMGMGGGFLTRPPGLASWKIPGAIPPSPLLGATTTRTVHHLLVVIESSELQKLERLVAEVARK